MISRYWINRITNNYKRNGIKLFILSGLSFLNKILNPKHTGEIPFKYLFIKKRRSLIKFAKKNLDKLDNLEIKNLGNYMLDASKLDKNSIIYSFGVGTSISFEEEIVKLLNCNVYCYDPTSMAVNWIKNHNYNQDKIHFSPIGVWNKDGKVKFYAQVTDDLNISGGSITNLFKDEKFDYLECKKIKSIISENKHNHINLLKLDIEGAAFEVIEDIIKDEIFPDQIIAEFEYSSDDNFNEQDFSEWSNRLIEIINVLRKKGYKCYYLPRFTHMAFSTMEICFVKYE